MTRVWISGIVISLAAHLAVAAVLLLALDLEPAGQQPGPGTRLTVSAVGVPQRTALARPLPAVALRARSTSGTDAPLAAIAAIAAKARVAAGREVPLLVSEGRPATARARPGLSAKGRVPAGSRLAAEAPAGDARRANAARGEFRPAHAPRHAVAFDARALPGRGISAGAVSGLARSARKPPFVPTPAEGLAMRRLAARPAALAEAAAFPLVLTAGDAHVPASRMLMARAPDSAALGARSPTSDMRIAMIPAGRLFDAQLPVPVALADQMPAARRGQAVPPGGWRVPPSPLAALHTQGPARPMTRTPAPPGRLSVREVPSPSVSGTALPGRSLPVRPAPIVKDIAWRGVAAQPPAPRRPADFLWSGVSSPDPASLAALRALGGATETAALVARAQIERVLADQHCSRVQAHLDPAAPRLTLHGHVPDLRAAGTLMAALRGPLGRDVPLSAEITTLPRPLCDHVAGLAALRLRPVGPGAPGDAPGVAIQSAPMIEEGPAGPALRLTEGAEGFVHVDLYDAGGEVEHLRPPPGTLPVRGGPGGWVRLDLPDRAGQGPAVLAVLITSRPLYLWPRARREPAGVYLRFLGNQVAAKRQVSDFTGVWHYAILPAVAARE